MTDVFATGAPALSRIRPVTVVGLCADATAACPSINTSPAMPANSLRDILAMFPTSRGLGGYNDWTGRAPPSVGTTTSWALTFGRQCHRGLSGYGAPDTGCSSVDGSPGPGRAQETFTH